MPQTLLDSAAAPPYPSKDTCVGGRDLGIRTRSWTHPGVSATWTTVGTAVALLTMTASWSSQPTSHRDEAAQREMTDYDAQAQMKQT